MVSEGVQRKETHKGTSEGTAREVGGKLGENSSWEPAPQSVSVAPALGENQMEQIGGQVEPGAGLGSLEEFGGALLQCKKGIQRLALSAQSYDSSRSPE